MKTKFLINWTSIDNRTLVVKSADTLKDAKKIASQFKKWDFLNILTAYAKLEEKLELSSLEITQINKDLNWWDKGYIVEIIKIF